MPNWLRRLCCRVGLHAGWELDGVYWCSDCDYREVYTPPEPKPWPEVAELLRRERGRRG